MAFAKIKTTQNQFLQSYLKGTGRKLSSAQARAQFGVSNLRARMSELRKAGMTVETTVNRAGRTAYSIL
jgi:hypothetical protein